MVDAESRLWDRLRVGDREGVVAAVLEMPVSRRRELRRAMREHDAVVAAAPIGARVQTHWDGGLRAGHHSAATAALLGCSTVDQATRLTFVGLDDARVLPRALFPADLDAFVEAWAQRFLQNPKAWDRISGIEAMFEWAQEGLIPAPTQRGAVLLLAAGFQIGDGEDCLRYLEARPVLIDATLRLVFDTEGIKGASPAQRDAARSPGSKMADYVIPELIRRGHWSREFVANGIARASVNEWPAYQLRWFLDLHRSLERLGPP